MVWRGVVLSVCMRMSMQFNVFTRTHGHMMYIGSIAHKSDEAREPSKSLSGSFRAQQIEGCDIGCSAGALLGNQKSRFHTLPMEIRKTHERPVPVAVILTITFKATLDPLKVEN